jgi:hypothetical protein
MAAPFTRRDFLKLSAVAGGWLFFPQPEPGLPPEDQPWRHPVGKGRVTIQAIGVYPEPSFHSDRLAWRPRDELLDLFEEIISEDGSALNPLWYRVAGGFVNSAYVQRVESAHTNPVLSTIPKGGRLGEVTVPFTQSFQRTQDKEYYPLYRLYYESVYWITRLIDGPDGEPLYGLTDDRLRVVYYVPAAHLRPVEAHELSPISPEVPEDQKRIEVSVEKQHLIAYEGKKEVLRAPVSTGLPSNGPTLNGIPTDTPQGHFRIVRKTPSRHMGNGDLTSDPNAYEYPGVPWVSYFHSYGVALHGAYWHDNFGSRMSSGCVNMRNPDAKWIYRWATPQIDFEEWVILGRVTTVRVFE